MIHIHVFYIYVLFALLALFFTRALLLLDFQLLFLPTFKYARFIPSAKNARERNKLNINNRSMSNIAEYRIANTRKRNVYAD